MPKWTETLNNLDQHTRKLAAILFTDMVGYTAVMQKDESKAILMQKRHQQTVEGYVQQFGGEVKNDMGDGSMSIFNSAYEAIKCAMAIQKELQGGTDKVNIRVGIHIADILIEESGKIHGDGINIASRIETLGVAGAILFSSEVNNKIKNQPELQTVLVGTFPFKNVETPMEIYAISNEGYVFPSEEEAAANGKLQKIPISKPSSDNTVLTKWWLLIIPIILILTFITFKFQTHEDISIKEKNKFGSNSADTLNIIVSKFSKAGSNELNYGKIIFNRLVEKMLTDSLPINIIYASDDLFSAVKDTLDNYLRMYDADLLIYGLYIDKNSDTFKLDAVSYNWYSNDKYLLKFDSISKFTKLQFNLATLSQVSSGLLQSNTDFLVLWFSGVSFLKSNPLKTLFYWNKILDINDFYNQNFIFEIKDLSNFKSIHSSLTNVIKFELQNNRVDKNQLLHDLIGIYATFNYFDSIVTLEKKYNLLNSENGMILSALGYSRILIHELNGANNFVKKADKWFKMNNYEPKSIYYRNSLHLTYLDFLSKKYPTALNRINVLIDTFLNNLSEYRYLYNTAQIVKTDILIAKSDTASLMLAIAILNQLRTYNANFIADYDQSRIEFNFGLAYYKLGWFEDAIHYFDHTLTFLSQHYSDDYWVIIEIKKYRLINLIQARRFSEALPLAFEEYNYTKTKFDNNSQEYFNASINLACIYLGLNDKENLQRILRDLSSVPAQRNRLEKFEPPYGLQLDKNFK